MKKTGIWTRMLALTMAAVLVTGSSAVTGMAEEAMAFDTVESTVPEQLSEDMSEETEAAADSVAAMPDALDTPDMSEETETLPEKSDIIISEESEPVITQPDTDVTEEVESAQEQPNTDVSAETELSDMEITGGLTIEDVQPMEQSPELIDTYTEYGVMPFAGQIDGVLEDGSDIEVTISGEEDCKWYSFTPSEDGAYIIYSEADWDSSADPSVQFYRADSDTPLDECSYVDSEYWGGENNLASGDWIINGFILKEYLQAGITYYYVMGGEGTYKAHFRKVPEIQDISIEPARTFVAGVDSAEDALELIVTLTYGNGIEKQLHYSPTSDVVYDYDYDNDEDVVSIYDQYGTEIRLNMPFLNDDYLNRIFPEQGSYTISASVAGKEASTEAVFRSMQDVANDYIIGEDGVISLEGTEDRLYAGYIPKNSGKYWILAENGSLERIYDTETQERLEYVENSFHGGEFYGEKYELTAGKTYLLRFYGGEFVSGKVEHAAEIESVELNTKDKYDLFTMEEELRSLQGSVTYVDGTKEVISDQWKIESVEGTGVVYYYELKGGECLYLSLDNGERNETLPDAEYNVSPAVGTYTLRVVSNWNDIYTTGEETGRELLRWTVTVTTPDDLGMTELSLGESDSFSGQAGEARWFAFQPEYTGVYRFELISNDQNLDCTLYGSQYDRIQNWECSKQKTPLTQLLKGGEVYYYKVRNKGEKEVIYELSLGEVQIKPLSAGMEFQPNTSEYDCEWFSYTAEETAIYEMTARFTSNDYRSGGIYVKSYTAQWEEIDYWDLCDGYPYYQKAGETYYFEIWDNEYGYYTDLDEYSVSFVKEPIQNLSLNQKVSGSDGQWFFTPAQTDEYTFLTVDLEAEGDPDYLNLECLDEDMSCVDRNTGYNESENQYGETVYDLYCNLTLEAGHTYLFQLDLPERYNKAFQVCVSGLSETRAIAIAFDPEYWEHSFVIEEGSDVLYLGGRKMDIVYGKGAHETICFDAYDFGKEDEYFENVILLELYEADAYGNPDLEKQVEFDVDALGYIMKPGDYVLIAKVWIFDENGDFVPNDAVTALWPISVTCGHTFEKITEKAATCTETGKMIDICKICGYRDSASEQIIPATGHTGGKATCEKGAVCEYCGQEYTAATGHNFADWKTSVEATVFQAEQQIGTCTVCGRTTTRSHGNPVPKTLKLNASSLKMQTKQKTTKLTVTMGAGDSVASVESSNTKVLKATVKKGKITLTAQKKTGKSNVKITLASGLSKTVKVTVQKNKVATTSVKGVSKKITLKKKQKITLKPTLNPITSQDKIKYTTSNKSVATVSSQGRVTAKKKGKAVITIKAGKKSVKCTITVK